MRYTVATTIIAPFLSLRLLAPLPAQSPDPLPVPRMQVIPLPDNRASFQDNGRELARYHFGPNKRRPFVFPIIGPSGRSLTRMGHPHDPVSHSHHNSVWISHNSVGGEDFWGDGGNGVIVTKQVSKYDDGDEECSLIGEDFWIAAGPDGAETIQLQERRRIAARPLEGESWMLLVDLLLRAPEGRATTLGQTAFGPIGVRMAKTIGVNDGGGMIRNSEGNEGEQGPNGCFRKPARWVDYSGPITNDAIEGITLMDHPQNPGHPTPFHVRADGWMGASLTLGGPIEITPEKPLRLRYGLFVHPGRPEPAAIDKFWRQFAHEPLASLQARN